MLSRTTLLYKLLTSIIDCQNMATSKVIAGSLILLIIMPIQGKWIFDLELQSYTNLMHARYLFFGVYCCCDCPTSISCCQNQLSSLNTCTDRDCNNKFLICFSDESSETCVYSDTVEDDDSISFSSGFTQGGINNPLQYDGDGQEMLTVNIYVFDDLTATIGTSDYRQNYIDDIQVDIEFGVTDGIGSPTTYNGQNGVISMIFGYGIRCAEGYTGNDCSTLSPMDCSTCNTTIAEFPPIQGKWIFDLELQSYTNPKHARYLFSSSVYCCCDCPTGGITCCENQLSSLNTCTDRDCNNKFLICFSDGSSETCVYSDTVRDDDSISFSSGLTRGGINNPLQYDGDGQEMLTVNIYVFDDFAATTDISDYRQNYIDSIQVDIEFDVTDGIGSPTTYNGENGVISMTFGYGIRCAEGYTGNDCSTLSPMDCSTCNTTMTECPDCPTEAAPEIITPPDDTNVLQNHNASLVCAATSEPMHTTQWFKGDSIVNGTSDKYTIIQMPGLMERETVSMLTVYDAVMNDTDDYTCVVTNVHGSQNHTAHLEVQVTPIITTPPFDSIGIFSETSNLTCQAFGSPVPNITWIKDGIQLDPFNDLDLSTDTYVNEFTRTSILFFNNLDFDDSGSYVCRAVNNLVSPVMTDSESATFTVNHPPVLQGSEGLAIVNETQTINMSCAFFSLPSPDITWSRSIPSMQIMDNEKYTIYTMNIPSDGGVLSLSTLEIMNVDGLDTTSYTCLASNFAHGPSAPVDTSSNTFFVIVQTSPVVQRISEAISIGVKTRDITLQFLISEDVPAVPLEGIRWYLQRDNISEIIGDSRRVFSHDRKSLSLSDLELDDEGNYTMNATNIIGTGSGMIYLDVEISPVITNNSGVVNQVIGQDAIFQCIAVSEPVHITNWTFKGNPLSNSDKYLIQGTDTTQSILTVYNVSLIDEGMYTCITHNVHGNNSATAELRVQVPPVITQQPQEVVLLVTTTAYFSCCATGVPSPSISWLKDDVPLLSDARVTMFQVGLCGTLRISNITLTDTADYTCVASNTLAELLSVNSSDVSLTVNYPPEVYPFTQRQYTKNESDRFILECESFGVPLPTLYWIPSSLMTLLNDSEQSLFPNQLLEFFNNIEGFNNSRFFDLSNQCLSMEPKSENNSDVCSNNSSQYTDCSVSGSLCPVPCALDISNRIGVDEMDRYIIISRLTICSLEKIDELSYTCFAVNNISNVINTAEATYAKLIVQVPPHVLIDTDNPLGVVNQSVTLTFSIIDAFPQVILDNIQWMFNDTVINNFTEPLLLEHIFSPDLLSLTLTNVQHSDQGYYSLTATNEAGTNTTSVFLEVEAAPVIITPPSNELQLEGNDVIFECQAIAEPIHSVEWMFKNQLLDTESNKYSTDSTGELTISNVQLNDTGLYTCTVSNIHGSASASAYLTLQGCPGGTTPNRQCLVNPCSYFICNAFPNAQCEVDACDSCIPRYTVGVTEVTAMCNSSCDPDTKRFNCLLNPCDDAYCPNFPDANCLPDYCGGCSARFYDTNSVEVTDECTVCPDDKPELICPFNLCDHQKCLNFPDANCVFDVCGGCTARFYSGDIEVTDDCVFCEARGQIFTSSGGTCQERTCENLGQVTCAPISSPGCDCPIGMVLDTLNNTCVFLEDCPCPDCDLLPANCSVIIPPSATEQCGCNTCGECLPGEVFNTCRSCPRTCAELIDPNLCIAMCERGCGCPEGKLLDEETNKCVSMNECPKLDICTLPAERGICKGRIKRYYYNSATKTCELFQYGGCFGNENNFRSLHDCEKACSDRPPTCTPIFCAIERKAMCYIPNTDSSSCSKDYSVSNCQACHYSTALQPSSCNFDCVDNNGEYDDACLSNWGACLFQKYLPIFRSVPRKERVPGNFKCIEYRC